MREILDQLIRWRDRGGEPMALATVLPPPRSAPRPVGAKLAVSEQGELAGSVSGGCVESEVAVAARDVLARGEPTVLTYGITDEQAGRGGPSCRAAAPRARSQPPPATSPPGASRQCSPTGSRTSRRGRSACPAGARSTSASS